jgi:hypothetical protein
MQRYLSAALAVPSIQAPRIVECYKLFDLERLIERSSGDWHQFLVRYLRHKLAQVSPYLSRDVPQFAAKVEHLRILSANTYSPQGSDGHYHWCVANLSNQHYWSASD